MARILISLKRLGQQIFLKRPDVQYLMSRRTKVSILDCGTDASQLRNIIGRSFIEDSGIEDEKSASHWHTVTDPHGTQMANLIRKMDPFSFLYTAKVDHDGVQISPATKVSLRSFLNVMYMNLIRAGNGVGDQK